MPSTNQMTALFLFSLIFSLSSTACEEDSSDYEEVTGLGEDSIGDEQGQDASTVACTISDCKSEFPVEDSDGAQCWCNAVCIQREVCCSNAASVCERIWELAGAG